MPPRQTSIGILSAAIGRLEINPFSGRCVPTTTDLIDVLGKETPFRYRMVFGNMWLFGPVAQRILSSNQKSNALIRTTVAPTVLHTGKQPASVSRTAKATLNI
jgi:carboxypeptidase PM20D1